MDGSEEIQAFAYERKGNSAVIRRCFSRDTKAAVPGMIDGLPVTELAPYAFSAHMDQQLLEQELVAGRLQLGRSMLVPEEDEVLTSPQLSEAAAGADPGALRRTAGGAGTAWEHCAGRKILPLQLRSSAEADVYRTACRLGNRCVYRLSSHLRGSTYNRCVRDFDFEGYAR